MYYYSLQIKIGLKKNCRLDNATNTTMGQGTQLSGADSNNVLHCYRYTNPTGFPNIIRRLRRQLE
jgi:hypothetical protein